MSKVRIVGIGGTARAGSTSEKLLGAVLDRCAALGAETALFAGADLMALPHYAPDLPDRSAHQAALVRAVRGADGLVIATPGYHGGVSALVKNALDLLEDTRLDGRTYLDGRPVGLVVSAAGWQAVGTTLSSLRDIVCALRGWPAPIGIAVNSSERSPFEADGSLAEGPVRNAIGAQAEQLMSFCAAHRRDADVHA